MILPIIHPASLLLFTRRVLSASEVGRNAHCDCARRYGKARVDAIARGFHQCRLKASGLIGASRYPQGQFSMAHPDGGKIHSWLCAGMGFGAGRVMATLIISDFTQTQASDFHHRINEILSLIHTSAAGFVFLEHQW